MKRLLKTTLILLVIALGCLAAWRLTGPHGVGDLYRRYADQPGVRVGYIKDFPFYGSTTVDVTTVEALDSAGWAWMLDEFEVQSYEDADIVTRQRDDGRFLFLSRHERKLCLVDARTDRQYDAVLRYQLKTLKASK